MKIVELTTDMRPWQRGATAVLPDDAAARLVASGDATNSRPFPESTEAEDPQKKPKLTLPERGKYQTKARP